jgi:hypothetical protein
MLNLKRYYGIGSRVSNLKQAWKLPNKIALPQIQMGFFLEEDWPFGWVKILSKSPTHLAHKFGKKTQYWTMKFKFGFPFILLIKLNSQGPLTLEIMS